MSNNDACKALPPKITLKLWGRDGIVKTYRSSKRRRIIAKVEADNFLKAYLKVRYGKALLNTGKVEGIINDGTYENQKDLLNALSVFTEKQLLEDTEKWTHQSPIQPSHKKLQSDPARNME